MVSRLRSSIGKRIVHYVTGLALAGIGAAGFGYLLMSSGDGRGCLIDRYPSCY